MFEKEAFIADCRQALTEHSPQQAMKEVLERALANSAELERAFGPVVEGKLDLLYHAPTLTILHVVWSPQVIINPHNHRMWAAIGVYGGQEDNTFYRRVPGGLAEANRKTLGKGDAMVLGAEVIHAVENPRCSLTGAIHIYNGDFINVERCEWNPPNFVEGPYDLERARSNMREANTRARALGHL